MQLWTLLLCFTLSATLVAESDMIDLLGSTAVDSSSGMALEDNPAFSNPNYIPTSDGSSGGNGATSPSTSTNGGLTDVFAQTDATETDEEPEEELDPATARYNQCMNTCTEMALRGEQITTSCPLGCAEIVRQDFFPNSPSQYPGQQQNNNDNLAQILPLLLSQGDGNGGGGLEQILPLLLLQGNGNNGNNGGGNNNLQQILPLLLQSGGDN